MLLELSRKWGLRDTTSSYKESFLLSNFHCFFVVMSEEIVGLVGLHGFPPILAKVKHCTRRKTGRGSRVVLCPSGDSPIGRICHTSFPAFLKSETTKGIIPNRAVQ